VLVVLIDSADRGSNASVGRLRQVRNRSQASLFEAVFLIRMSGAAERGALPSTVLGPGFVAGSAIIQISEQL